MNSSLAIAARAAFRALASALLFATLAVALPRAATAQAPDTTWLLRNRFEDLTGACTPRGWTAEQRTGSVYAHVTNRWTANTPFMTGRGGASNAGEITNDAATSKLGQPHGLSEGDSSTVLFLDMNLNLSFTLYQVYPNGLVRPYASFTAAQNPRFVAHDPVSGGAVVSVVDGLMRVPAGGGAPTRIAGGGTVPFGDTTAFVAQFIDVRGVAIDASGVIYFADHGFHKVHKLRPDGRVVTVAGTGTVGYTGDGSPATGALLNRPFGIALDASANALYLMQEGDASFGNAHRALRRVDLATGLISTVAIPTYLFPHEVAVSNLGVLGVGLATVDHVVAGTYAPLTADVFDFFTDIANQNQLSELRAYQPSGLAPMSDGGFLFTSSYLLYRVSPAGVVAKVAGTAVPVQMGTRALWFGADSTSAPGEVANWVHGHGYGNGWSQRIESPTFSYAGITPVTLEFDGVIEIDNNATLTTTFNNEGIAVDARRTDGVWVPLDVVAISHATDGPIQRLAGRDMFHAVVNVNVPGGPFDRVRVRMQSDYRNSNEDGVQVSTMGGGLIDNLRLTVGTTVVTSHDFEDGTTGAWTLSAFNGMYSVGGSIPYYTLDFTPPPTTQVGLQTGFDPADPSCVWTFTGSSGYLERGTFARITSPWIATGDSIKQVLIDLSGKLSVNWSGYATQIVARVKTPGAGAHPTIVAQPFFTFDTGFPATDPFVPYFTSLGPINFPNDFDVSDNVPPIDSIQIVINVVDVRMNYPITIQLPPNTGPTRFPYFDDIRIAQVGADTDRDGVPTRKDACPLVSAAGEDADGDGCLDATASLHHVETWMLAARPIHYRISSDGMPQIADNSDVNAIRFAVQAWGEVEGASVPVVEDALTTQKNASAFDGINLVTFQDPDFTFAPGVLAVTPTLSLVRQGTWNDQPVLPGQILDADMILNPQAPFSTTSFPGQYDLQSVATHEAGHLLGLSHSPVQDATMFFVIQPGAGAATLQADDEAAIAAAYPGATLGTAFGAITGQVRRGANRQPIGGAAVTARLLDGSGDPIGPEISDYTRDDGSYALRRLAPGNYGVRVDPIDGSQGGLTVDRINDKVVAIAEINFQPEWYSVPEDSADDPAAKEAVVVSAGSAASAIDIVTNVDLVPPVVTSVSPSDGASAIRIDALVAVSFSEPIAGNTIGTAFHLRVQGAGTSLPGSGQLIGGTRFVFAPTTPLQFGTTYELEITTALTDDEGVPLAGTFATTFATEPEPPLAITNIIPSVAVEGQLITIEGAGFAGDDSARWVSFYFPPEAAAVLVEPSVISSTQLVVRIPLGAATGAVELLFAGGAQGPRQSNAFGLTIVPPPPQAAPIPSVQVALNFDPFDLALSPGGSHAFAVGNGGMVGVDLTAAPVVTLFSSQPADAIALTPNGTRAAVVRTAAGHLDIVNTDPSSGAYGNVLQQIPTSAPPRAVALSPNGKRAYVVAGGDHVDEIDIDAASPTAWQVVRSRHVIAGGPLRPLITVDPRGTQLFLADPNNGVRVPLAPDTVVTATIVADGVDGGIAMSPSGLEYLAASYPGSGHFVTVQFDAAGVPEPSPNLEHVGLSTRDVAIAREGQSAFFVDEVLNQLLVVNITRSDAAYRQPVGSVTTGQAPVAVTTASLASVIGVANRSGRTLSFYTYGGSGLELTSVIPPVAYPGDQVAVAGAGNYWISGTQAEIAGSLHPTSLATGTGAAFAVPPVAAQNTTLTLQGPSGQRSYARPFEIVSPLTSLAFGVTGIVPPQQPFQCFGDSGVGLPRRSVLSPDGRLLVIYAEHTFGCHRLVWIRTSSDGGDSLGRVLHVGSYSFAPDGMAFTPDSRQLWVGFASHGGSRLDADPDSPTFGTAAGPNLGYIQAGQVASDPLGRWMYVYEKFPGGLGPQGIGLVSLTTNAIYDTLAGDDGPIASSPDGHWLITTMFNQTRVRIFDVSTTHSPTPPVLTTDRTASGAGALLMLQPSSDGRRMVCVFANGFVQVVNLDPAAGAVGDEVWFGQPIGPGDISSITHGPTPTTVLISRGTAIARVDVSTSPAVAVTQTLANPATMIAASSDGRRVWAGRGFTSGPGGGAPGVVTTVIDLLTQTDAASLALLSGSGQQSLVNQLLPTPIRVKVKQADGDPEPGVVVRFTAPAGTTIPEAGPSQTIDRITNNAGEAEITWKMGPAPGTFAISAQVLGTSIATVQATAQAVLDDASIEPVIVAFGPATGATGLGAGTPVYVRFNQKMQLSTVENGFLLQANSSPVIGSFSTSDGGYTVLFQPSQPLPYSAACEITVFDGALDTDGQSLATGGTASFTVQAPPTLALISLSPPAGLAGTPVVIQGAGLSATPSSNVVLFNGTLAPVTTAGTTSLQTAVPLAATTGDVTVQVGALTSNALAFTVLNPNPVPGAVIGTIPASQGIRAIQVTPDGSRAYVTNPTTNEVSAISIAGGTVITRIAVGLTPQGIGILPDGRRAYVANTGSDNVSVIDIDPQSPTYHTVVNTVTVGDQPIGVAVASLGPRVIVHNVGSNTISVIDADASNATYDQVVTTTSTGSSGKSGGVTTTQDGGLAWVVGANGVVNVNLVAGTATEIVTNSAVADLTITPNQTLVLALLENGDLIVIDALPSSNTFNQVVTTTSTGSSGKSGGVTTTQDGTLAYVTDGAGNTIYVFKITSSTGAAQQAGVTRATRAAGASSVAPGPAVTLTLVTTLTAGAGASGIDFDPNNQFGVVANTGDGTITIIGVPTSLPAVVCTFGFNPNSLNLKSLGKWVNGTITPPAPWTAAQIDVSSLRLEGVVPVDPAALTSIDGNTLTVRFDRAALALLLPEGDHVPVHLTGMIGGTRLLEGVDSIKVKKAKILNPHAGTWTPPGSSLDVQWEVPAGTENQPVALIWTANQGMTWTLITTHQVNDGSYTWQTPPGTRDSVKVGVVIVDSGDLSGDFEGVLGVSDYFAIASGPLDVEPLPSAIQFAPVAPNPSRGMVSMRYGLPRAARVTLDVFDLQGRRVKRLVDESKPAGWHQTTWRGDNATGRHTGAGLYFVRFKAEDRIIEQRLVRIE